MKKLLIVISLSLIVIVFLLRSLGPDVSLETLAPPVGAPLAAATAEEPTLTTEPATAVHAKGPERLAGGALAREVTGFHENHFLLGGLDRNREVVQRLAEDEEGVKHLASIVRDARNARALFGEEQAAGRVLAIQVLGARARAGDARLLEEATEELGARFADLDDGGRADFRDLAGELIATIGPEVFFADPSIVMNRFKNPTNVAGSVLAASVAHLGDRINDPEFSRKMRAWLR